MMSTATIWRTSAVTLLVAAAGLIAASPNPVQAQAAMPAATVAASELPKGKQTTLGLYVTAAQAYEMWKAAPDKVKIIDVRTPEEFAFVGHPEMAWNIPLAFVTYERKGGKFQYAPKPNTAFVAQVREIAKPTDVLLVTCRSGGRGAMAVNQLAAAGFTNAYNIVDGIEGDTGQGSPERLQRQEDEERLEELRALGLRHRSREGHPRRRRRQGVHPEMQATESHCSPCWPHPPASPRPTSGTDSRRLHVGAASTAPRASGRWRATSTSASATSSTTWSSAMAATGPTTAVRCRRRPDLHGPGDRQERLGPSADRATA